MSQQATNYGFLNSLLQELGTQKTAAVKAADEPLSEAGGYMGATTHPSKSVEDHTQNATEGSRSSENERDVKANRESPSVNATSEATASTGAGGGKQDEVQLNIGTTQSSTGDDPSVEDSYKGDKEDPGTTHPMDTSIGPKYGAYRQLSTAKLAAAVIDKGNELLADIAVQRKQAAGVTLGANLPAAGTAPPATRPPLPAAPAPAGTTAPVATPKLAAAAQLGYDLAAALGAPQEKQAAAQHLIAATVKEAAHMADLTASHLIARHNALRKQADDSAEEGEDHSMPGDAASGASDSGAMGGGPGMGGGGDMGGGDMGGGMGGPPPGVDPAMMGGDPMMGGGPPPPGAGGPGGGGGVSNEQALQELAAALMEMGIDPQQLAAAAAAGGAPGGPPMPPKEAQQLKSACDNVSRMKIAGRWGFGPPADEKRARLRSDFRNYVAEILGSR